VYKLVLFFPSFFPDLNVGTSFLSPHSCYMFRLSPIFVVTILIGLSAKEWASSEAAYYFRSSISLRSFSLFSNVLPSTVFSTIPDLCLSRNVGYVLHPYQTINEIRILCMYFNQFLRNSLTISKEELPELNLSLNPSSTHLNHCCPEPSNLSITRTFFLTYLY
jgi:hypothetical protein